MDFFKENHISLPDERRSPFSVSASEITFVIIAALLTWFGLRIYLHSLMPYPCTFFIDNVPVDCNWTREQAWQTLGIPLFSKYIIPFLVLNTAAAVSFVRIFRRDVRGVSRLGSVALAWPLVSFFGIHFLFYAGLCSLPVGFMVALVATVTSVVEKRFALDRISLPVSILNIIACGMYLNNLAAVYGD